MIRSVLLPMVTKSPNRVRFASDAGMHAQANFTAMQRAIVGLVLRDLFTPPDRLLFTHPGQTGLVPNRIVVTFSRLSRGTLDGWENLRSAFKGCKDEVAAWCGIDDKEGAGITWADPLQLPGKAKHPAIRIVIEDLTPCDDRAVELNDRQMAEYTARAKLKVKADKAARDLAKLLRPKEAKVSRNRGRKADPRDARAEGRKLFERASAKKAPRALAERPEGNLAGLHPESIESARSNGGIEETLAAVAWRIQRSNDAEGPGADFAILGPDGTEDGTPRTEADCPHAACMARAPAPCIVLGGDKLVHGVHPERARAAGVVGVSAPPRRKTGAQGPRKLAAKVEIEAWLSCPWWPKCRPCGGTGFGEAPPGAYPVVPCPTCHGTGLKLARIPALDGDNPPREQSFNVPEPHRARFGPRVVLVRREWSRADKVCWLYRPA